MTNPSLDQRFWLVDTRSIWNSSTPSTSANPSNTINDTASDALALISSSEREKATRFHFHRDAKLSLASSLLKRHFISTTFPSAHFSSLDISRRGDPKHGKPSYSPPAEEKKEVDFNISHQAGLVALAGYGRPTSSTPGAEPSITVGVDITNTAERTAQDHRFIQRSGFESWMDMHGEVFSPADLTAMKALDLDDYGAADPASEDIDARRRKFYSYWCLKEAYVKLEGEALLAGWLKEVSFKSVEVPAPGRSEGAWGEHVKGIEIWRGGKREDATRLELRSWGPDFIIGLAVKGDADGVLSGSWEMLDIEKVVTEQSAKG